MSPGSQGTPCLLYLFLQPMMNATYITQNYLVIRLVYIYIYIKEYIIRRASERRALQNVDKTRSIRVGRQEEAAGFDDAASYGNAGTLELLVALVEELGEAGFGLNAACRLQGI